ncbi:MAG: hypothetical protein JSV97_12780 [candidate division WOR-3 bacterium]|nr:MAG: hypothetical protein JSV97_12780 [candidate division WOR-3 bacterium]
MKKIALIIIGVVIVIMIMRLMPSEKDRLKRNIYSLRDAVEREEKTLVLQYIDEAYLDRYNTVYEELIVSIDDFFKAFDSIRVVMSGLNVKIDSTDAQKTIFASCSLGLKVFARYEGERALVFGGIIKPDPVRAYFKKSGEHYRIYAAEY